MPLHPFLAEIGFLDWMESADSGRLFPEASKGKSETPSQLYSKRFNTVLVNAGDWVPRKQVFHSFRDNFTDALRDGGVDSEHRTALCGWQAQAKMDAPYGRGFKIERLYEAVCKLRYDRLDLSRLLSNPDEHQLPANCRQRTHKKPKRLRVGNPTS